jgi:hypothetical protein
MYKDFSFTKLLIAATVVCILASGVIFSDSSVAEAAENTIGLTDSAKASELVMDLRNAKAAGIMWLIDNKDFGWAELKKIWSSDALANDIVPYFENSSKIKELIFVVTKDEYFLVGKLENDVKVIEKAIGMAGGALHDKFGNPLTVDTARDGIYMRVR